MAVAVEGLAGEEGGIEGLDGRHPELDAAEGADLDQVRLVRAVLRDEPRPVGQPVDRRREAGTGVRRGRVALRREAEERAIGQLRRWRPSSIFDTWPRRAAAGLRLRQTPSMTVSASRASWAACAKRSCM